MEYVARKFSKAKWLPKPFMVTGDIAADAVTGCLRTSDNKLSLWRCANDRNSVEEVALALATTYDGPSKTDVVVFPLADLESANISVESSVGGSLIEELNERHMDAIELTSDRLSMIAQIVSRYVDREAHSYRFTLESVRQLVKTAERNGRLSKSDLKAGFQEAI